MGRKTDTPRKSTRKARKRRNDLLRARGRLTSRRSRGALLLSFVKSS
jgi:hypothetical protein